MSSSERDDYEWDYCTQEPHATRRKEILDSNLGAFLRLPQSVLSMPFTVGSGLYLTEGMAVGYGLWAKLSSAEKLWACGSPYTYFRQEKHEQSHRTTNYNQLMVLLRISISGLTKTKYPQIKKLFGADPTLQWKVIGMVVAHIISCYLVKDQSWPVLLLVSYCFGGILSHSMTLAIHELSHNLAYGNATPAANRALAIFGNLIIGVPSAVTFKKYHIDHHRCLGVHNRDVDVPTEYEAKLFKYTLGKLVWMFLQPFFYGLRPLFIYPMPVTKNEVINAVVVFGFDALIYYFWGFKALFYVVGGAIIAMGIHPIAGHFISEHYMFQQGYETYSYYGPLNMITFNVGYHNEHHDFPFIAGSRLPKVREIAPEYYDNLPYHTSWVKVLYDFITDPTISLYCRVKRKPIPKSLDDYEQKTSKLGSLVN